MKRGLPLIALLCACCGCEAENKGGTQAASAGCASKSDCPSDHNCQGGVCTPVRKGRFSFDTSTTDAAEFDSAGVADDVSALGADAADKDSAVFDATTPDASAPGDTVQLDVGGDDTSIATDVVQKTDATAGDDAGSSVGDNGDGGAEDLAAPETSQVDAKPTTCVGLGDCNDGDPCTKETCVKGLCGWLPVSNCCKNDADCNDALVCTADSCIGNKCDFDLQGTHCLIGGACVAAKQTGTTPCQTCAPLLAQDKWTVIDGLACDDGSQCTTGDTCDAKGSCVGKPADCDDKDACTKDACVNKKCAHEPILGCGNNGPVKGIDIRVDKIETDKSAYKLTETIVATLTVGNAGDTAAGTFKVEFRLSQNDEIALGDPLLYTAFVASLKSQAQTVVKRNLKLPAGTSAGDWHIGAVVDAGGAIVEANEQNNTGATKVSLTK